MEIFVTSFMLYLGDVI